MIDSRHTQRAARGRRSHRVSPTALLAIGAVAVVALGSPADSAARRPKPKPPKPACNLVLDVGGDASDSSLDVVSADVATNATTLTWVIRPRQLTSSPDTQSPTGRAWQLSFVVGAKQVTLGVTDGPFGPQELIAYEGKISVDPSRNEVRYSVLLKSLTVPIVNGSSVLTGLTTLTESVVQKPSPLGYTGLLHADNAAGSRSYLAGFPSCVAVGG